VRLLGAKNPLIYLMPKRRSVAGFTHKAAVPLCKGGAGVQGFSWPVFSTLSTKPSGGLSPAGRVFSLC